MVADQNEGKEGLTLRKGDSSWREGWREGKEAVGGGGPSLTHNVLKTGWGCRHGDPKQNKMMARKDFVAVHFPTPYWKWGQDVSVGVTPAHQSMGTDSMERRGAAGRGGVWSFFPFFFNHQKFMRHKMRQKREERLYPCLEGGRRMVMTDDDDGGEDVKEIRPTIWKNKIRKWKQQKKKKTHITLPTLGPEIKHNKPPPPPKEISILKQPSACASQKTKT